MNKEYGTIFICILFVSAISYIGVSKNSTLTENVRLQQTATNTLLLSLQDILNEQRRNMNPIDHIPVVTEKTENIVEDNDPDYFGVDHGSFDPKIQLLKKYKILHKPNHCAKDTNLIIAIKSVSTNPLRRTSIRQSWGNSTYYENQTKLVFLFGKQNIERIQDEMKQYDDFLVGDFLDSFHNLTFKDSMILTWAKNDCPASFILKGDDDILINPFRIEELLRTAERNTPKIYGCALGGQPVERAEHSRYADFKWNKGTYPLYVSGGGFLLNWKAAMVLQEQIPQTPIISIDDAYIGIAMSLAGYGGKDYIEGLTTFRSWGFGGNHKKKFGICDIDETVYFHRFTDTEIACFWGPFIKLRHLCLKDQHARTEEEQHQLEEVFSCSPKLWFYEKMSPPILDGVDTGRCGKPFNFAACSIKPEEWIANNTLMRKENGPCCSLGGWCGLTDGHCVPGIDFREISEDQNWEFKDNSYLPNDVPKSIIAANNFPSLTIAQQECMKVSECSGVTKMSQNSFSLRTGKEFMENAKDKSWRKKSEKL